MGDGGQWATNWNLSGFATPITAISSSNTKNSATGGPNLFANPSAAFNAFEPNFPGTTGARNILRGYGFFNLDVAVQKRFQMPYNERHSLQIRAEAFNVTNSVANTGVVAAGYTAANKGTATAPNFVIAPCANATATTCAPTTPGLGNASGGFPDGTNARRAQAGLRFTF